MKEIKVIVVRRTKVSYNVTVPDDFDVDDPAGCEFLESDCWDFGNWEQKHQETLNWEIDYVGEIK